LFVWGIKQKKRKEQKKVQNLYKRGGILIKQDIHYIIEEFCVYLGIKLNMGRSTNGRGGVGD
jgi:hypothetical protein